MLGSCLDFFFLCDCWVLEMNWLSSDEDGIGDNGIPRVPRGLRLFARNVGAREVAEEERGRGLALASRIGVRLCLGI